MDEQYAKLWLDNMRTCLQSDTEWKSIANDILIFLEELACPKLTAEAKARMWVCPECGVRGYESSHVCGDGS